MRNLPTLEEYLAGPMYSPQLGSAPRPRNVPKLPDGVEDVHPLDIENALRRAKLGPKDYHLGMLTDGMTMVLSFSGEWRENAARGMAEIAKSVRAAKPVQTDDWGREFRIPKWNGVSEGTANGPGVLDVERDLKAMRIDGRTSNEVEIHGRTVTANFTDVGHWVHDEERGREQEDDGDMDWREDDDHMVLAPGERKRLDSEFHSWANGRAWYKGAKLEFGAHEKNWTTFTVTLK